MLALLYKGQGRPDLSLAIYLQLQLPSVFDFIQVGIMGVDDGGESPDTCWCYTNGSGPGKLALVVAGQFCYRLGQLTLQLMHAVW